jgi:serine protease Do
MMCQSFRISRCLAGKGDRTLELRSPTGKGVRPLEWRGSDPFSGPVAFSGLQRLCLGLLLASVSLIGSSPAAAQYSQTSRVNNYVKSSPRVLAAFRKVVARASRSTVRIECDGRPVALGTIVDAGGWILTKYSELHGTPVCVLKDGRELKARVVGVHERYDLAMLKVAATGLKPVQWADSKDAPVGNWVASPGIGKDPVAVGVVSVAARKVTAPALTWSPSPKSGYLGIALAPSEDSAKIGEVLSGTAAAKAGLKANDTILTISGKPMKNSNEVLVELSRYKPGDVVRVRVKRGTKEFTVEAKLGKRPMSRTEFQDRLGGPLSKVRQGFPMILQHDTVLKPTECGGPLVDLDGNVIGINIARAGRTESYAVPAEAIEPLLGDLRSGKLAPKGAKE